MGGSKGGFNAGMVLGLLALVGALAWFLVGGSPEDGARDEDAAGDGERARASGRAGGEEDGERDVHAEEKASISGTVTELGGNPLAGARACAWPSSRHVTLSQRATPSCSNTDAAGFFRIDGLLPIDHRVSASAADHVPAEYERATKRSRRDTIVRLRPGELLEGIDVALRAGGVLAHGIVRDVSGGEIEGAIVTSGLGPFNPLSASWSDAEGRFSLWVEAGQVQLTASAPGYASAQREGSAPGQTIELFLTPESVVVGRVVSAGNGRPVAGAKVAVETDAWWSGPRPDAFSDASGAFRIEGLDPGSYKLAATTTHGYGLSADTVHLGLGETSDPVTIELHPAFSVEGTVTLADSGEPCAYGGVELKDFSTDRVYRGKIEGEGAAVIRAVLPGEYTVAVNCRGASSLDRYDTIVVSDANVTGLAWEVRPGFSIRGQVSDAHGDPLRDIGVYASKRSGDDPRAKSGGAAWGEKTTDDGRFELPGLSPGTYVVETWGELPGPDEPIEVEISDADVDLDIELLGVGHVSGRVIDERGEPVAAVDVRSQGEKWEWRTVTTRDDGSFTMENLRPGEYRVLASRESWGKSLRAPGTTDDDVQGEPVTVVADQTANVELVVESQAGRIEGRVTGEGGEPVADAFVDAKRESDSVAARAGGAARSLRWSWQQIDRQPILTDQDGKFSLDQLSEGSYTLRAYRKGGGEAIAEGVATGETVELMIASPGSLSGRVGFAGGGSPDEFEIKVEDVKAGLSRQESFFRTNGHWSLSNLPAGHFEVRAEAARGSASTELDLAEAEARKNVDLTLNPKVTLRGTLIDHDTDAPVPGMRVQVQDGDVVMIRMGEATTADQKDVSDQNGSFEVERASTGKVRLLVIPKDFVDSDYDVAFMQKNIPAEPEVQQLPPIRLVKSRTGTDDRAGDLGYKTKTPDPGQDAADIQIEIAFIRPGGPAEGTGLQVGDVIIAVDGQTVTGDDIYLYQPLTSVPAGRTVTLGVARGENIEITATKPQ